MILKKKYDNIQFTIRRAMFLRSVSEGTNDIACDSQHHTREYNFLFPMANICPPGNALFVRLFVSNLHTFFVRQMRINN